MSEDSCSDVRDWGGIGSILLPCLAQDMGLPKHWEMFQLWGYSVIPGKGDVDKAGCGRYQSTANICPTETWAEVTQTDKANTGAMSYQSLDVNGTLGALTTGISYH